MARRISFDVTDEAAPATPEPVRAPSLSGMARSLQAAAAATVREIALDQIDSSGFRDRLELVDDEIEDLAQSIRAQGQLIPILVSPQAGGRFRIVYGRRRLEALRRLGLPAKALVREMDDTQAIIAQGQENSYRKDLSWIEKASFARQLLEAGRTDELICDALNIDQKARRNGEKLTGLSRMKQVCARIAPELINAVGPAPKVGRDRWYELSQKIDKAGLSVEAIDEIAFDLEHAREEGVDSDARFERLDRAVNRALTPQRKVSKDPVNDYQAPTGQVRATGRSATITIQARDAADLHAWIRHHPAEALAALAAACRNHTREKGETE